MKRTDWNIYRVKEIGLWCFKSAQDYGNGFF